MLPYTTTLISLIIKPRTLTLPVLYLNPGPLEHNFNPTRLIKYNSYLVANFCPTLSDSLLTDCVGQLANKKENQILFFGFSPLRGIS